MAEQGYQPPYYGPAPNDIADIEVNRSLLETQPLSGVEQIPPDLPKMNLSFKQYRFLLTATKAANLYIDLERQEDYPDPKTMPHPYFKAAWRLMQLREIACQGTRAWKGYNSMLTRTKSLISSDKMSSPDDVNKQGPEEMQPGKTNFFVPEWLKRK